LWQGDRKNTKGEFADMERLTNVGSKGEIFISDNDETRRFGRKEVAYEKLKEYEDAEEQGLMLRLPCKVGDNVYEVCKCDDTYKIFPMVVKDVSPYGTLRQCKSGDCVWNIYAESDYTYTYKSFYDLGKSVFLTKSEAEQNLKRMVGEKYNV
jgi:hypothetical protein